MDSILPARRREQPPHCARRRRLGVHEGEARLRREGAGRRVGLAVPPRVGRSGGAPHEHCLRHAHENPRRRSLHEGSGAREEALQARRIDHVRRCVLCDRVRHILGTNFQIRQRDPGFGLRVC